MWGEACSTAALLRALRHRTPTCTVPNSDPFRIPYFWEFQYFSRMHRWILNKQKYPQSFALTRCAGYKKKLCVESNTHCFTQVKLFGRFRNILCRIAFYKIIGVEIGKVGRILGGPLRFGAVGLITAGYQHCVYKSSLQRRQAAWAVHTQTTHSHDRRSWTYSTYLSTSHQFDFV